MYSSGMRVSEVSIRIMLIFYAQTYRFMSEIRRTEWIKAMFSRDTVKEELEEAGCGEKLVQSFKILGLEGQHPYDLSGGEQQRLGLSMVLSDEPELVLFDEPTKGLDVEAKRQIGDYLRPYVEQGHTVLCVTHDVEFAVAYADVFSLLFEGKILSTEPVQTFFENNAFYTTDSRRIFGGV